MGVGSLFGMRLFVHVEFASQQVGFLAGDDGRRDRHDPRFEFLRQRRLELPLGMWFDGDFDAAEFQFELGILDRAAVGIAVEIERQLLAIDDADQFKGFGRCRKTRRGWTGG